MEPGPITFLIQADGIEWRGQRQEIPRADKRDHHLALSLRAPYLPVDQNGRQRVELCS
jgi:hypothetical protein